MNITVNKTRPSPTTTRSRKAAGEAVDHRRELKPGRYAAQRVRPERAARGSAGWWCTAPLPRAGHRGPADPQQRHGDFGLAALHHGYHGGRPAFQRDRGACPRTILQPANTDPAAGGRSLPAEAHRAAGLKPSGRHIGSPPAQPAAGQAASLGHRGHVLPRLTASSGAGRHGPGRPFSCTPPWRSCMKPTHRGMDLGHRPARRPQTRPDCWASTGRTGDTGAAPPPPIGWACPWSTPGSSSMPTATNWSHACRRRRESPRDFLMQRRPLSRPHPKGAEGNPPKQPRRLLTDDPQPASMESHYGERAATELPWWSPCAPTTRWHQSGWFTFPQPQELHSILQSLRASSPAPVRLRTLLAVSAELLRWPLRRESPSEGVRVRSLVDPRSGLIVRLDHRASLPAPVRKDRQVSRS